VFAVVKNEHVHEEQQLVKQVQNMMQLGGDQLGAELEVVDMKLREVIQGVQGRSIQQQAEECLGMEQ
jgi:hypothetical protein